MEICVVMNKIFKHSQTVICQIGSNLFDFNDNYVIL